MMCIRAGISATCYVMYKFIIKYYLQNMHLCGKYICDRPFCLLEHNCKNMPEAVSVSEYHDLVCSR